MFYFLWEPGWRLLKLHSSEKKLLITADTLVCMTAELILINVVN